MEIIELIILVIYGLAGYFTIRYIGARADYSDGEIDFKKELK